MPYIDQIVLGLLLAGLLLSGLDHWRRGQRRWRLAALVFLSFYGVGLAAMLAAHCADIIYNTVLANRSVIDGSTFTYNWRTYSLLLFGVLIIDRGIRSLCAVRRWAAGDATARAEFLRNTGVVLAITLPTIPIHAFFGTIMTVWSSLALIVAAVGLRAQVGATPAGSVSNLATESGMLTPCPHFFSDGLLDSSRPRSSQHR